MSAVNQSATAWVLLRGLAREAGHWAPFIEQFKARFPNDEVLPIDLPGSGEFRKLRSPTNMHDIFTFVRGQAIERSKHQAQFKLVALSLGGMVAMKWMQHKPEDLSGCVLMNTSVQPLSPIYNRLRWEVWPQFVRILSAQVVREREQRSLELVMNNPEAREKALALWVKVGMDRAMSPLNFANQLLAAARFHGFKEAPSVPVLLLNGLGDRLVDPSCSTVLHEKWGWPLERHAWAGHDLAWDDPEWVLDKILTWNLSKDTSRH